MKRLAGIFMTWKLLARAPSLPKDSRKNVGLRQLQLISFSLSAYRQPSFLNYNARVVLNNRAGQDTWWRLQDDSHKYKTDITSSVFKVRCLAAVMYFVTTKHIGFPFHFIPETQKTMKQPFFTPSDPLYRKVELIPETFYKVCALGWRTGIRI